MSEQVTLQVPDYVMQHATQVATQTNKQVEVVLTDLLLSAVGEKPVVALSDAEVLALTKLRLPMEQEARLKDLLADHCEGLLPPEQQQELDRLMNVYERALLRQSQALREAVTRRLMNPLSHEQN